MFKGFYNLTSGMLTQQRALNVVANNLTNISTAGYKTDRYTSSTFDEVMISRVGNKYKDGAEEIGPATYIRASDQMYVDYTQGTIEPTAVTLDFAIEGDGFFAIQNEAGDLAYTRAGSFSLDEEGYLCLPWQGRVLNPDGQPIQLNTDRISAPWGDGVILDENGRQLGQLGVFSFPDNQALEHNDRGLFIGGGQAQAAQGYEIHWQSLERSNVSMIHQMTEMLTAQRALQSAAQVSKMYDSLMTKAANDIGRL